MDNQTIRLIELKMKNRVAQIANQHVYDHAPRLSPGQIQTLIQHPEMMDALIQKLGPKMVSVLMGQRTDDPSGLMPSQEKQNAISSRV